jgi:recombination DNA repair RAD52 pathway protein
MEKTCKNHNCSCEQELSLKSFENKLINDLRDLYYNQNIDKLELIKSIEIAFAVAEVI